MLFLDRLKLISPSIENLRYPIHSIKHINSPPCYELFSTR
ncbi:hypothetical protein VCR14J2_390098 [Vibrio coralliirubri]|nr:hypothetical protein VCR6J2_200024 [Vibrio coralliirubri]CDU05048.1 hypothetical protein VCR14J2_390098 [Vibrio coralliirubri]